MPLFQRRFSVPKFPARKASSMSSLCHLDSSAKSQDFGVDFGPIKTRLSGRDLIFRNGQWVIDGEQDNHELINGNNSNQTNRETFRLKKENHQLVEENNLLKLKIDILLDMLAETTAEVHLQENEIENLRSTLLKKTVNNPIHVS